LRALVLQRAIGSAAGEAHSPASSRGRTSGRRFAVSDYNPLDPDWRAKARAAGHYLVD